TRSACRPATTPRGEETGRQVGKGAGRAREQTGDLEGRGDDQGVETNGGNQGNKHGINRNQSGDATLKFNCRQGSNMVDLLDPHTKPRETEFWNHAMVRDGRAAYTNRFHELARLVPYLVTLKNKKIKRYIYGLAPEIQRMVAATEPTTIQKAMQKSGTLTNEAIKNGSLKKNREKRGNSGKLGMDRNVRDDNKKTRTGNVFATST
nr:reverse transcriptase domain-containing protein [Tanacetum cinerariifolium]